jgi:hypothetical protein
MVFNEQPTQVEEVKQTMVSESSFQKGKLTGTFVPRTVSNIIDT